MKDIQELEQFFLEFLDKKDIPWEEIVSHAKEEHSGLVGTSLFCLYGGESIFNDGEQAELEGIE